MKKIKSNFKLNKEKLNFLNNVEYEDFKIETLFSGTYKKDFWIIATIQNEIVNDKEISMKVVSISYNNNKDVKYYPELTESEINEIVNKFGIKNYRIWKSKNNVLVKNLKLIYIEELIEGKKYKNEEVIFSTDDKVN